MPDVQSPIANDDQAPAYRCAHCPRLLHADELHRYACRVCEDRATEQVRALPALYAQLEDVLAPGRAGGSAGRSPSGRTAPLPVALQPLNLRGPGGIVSMLLGIEQRWRIQLDWTFLPQRGGYEATLAGTAAFVANNLPWACDKYELVADDLDLIGSLHSQADHSVTGYTARTVWVTCKARYDDDTECGHKLRLDLNRSVTRCGNCGVRWGREEWVSLYESTRLQAA